MECTTPTAARVEVPQENAPAVVETDDEGVAPAAEGVVETESEEEQGPMSGDEGGDDEEPAAADAHQQPPNPEHLVEFHAKTTGEGPWAVTRDTRTAIHTAVKKQPGNMRLLQAAQAVLNLRRSADPYEIMERTASLIRFEAISSDGSLVMAVTSLYAAQMARVHDIGKKRMAAARATQAKKKKLANALARVAKLEALQTELGKLGELTEPQKKSLALDKKKVEAYSKELARK